MPNYTLNMPQATQTLAQTQQPIQDNFSVANSTMGTNHVPMTDGTVANRGKHKYVTLIRSPGAAAPVGTDLILSQEVSNTTPYIKAVNSTGATWPVGLRYTVTNIAVGAGHTSILDMTPYNSTVGTVLVWRNSTPSDQVFTSYVFPNGGAPSVQGGQLISGGKLTGITTSGNFLQIVSSQATNVSVTIMWAAF